MLISHVLTHGLFYGAVVTGYLLILMVTLSPRVWGYADYPEVVKRKVPPQTRRERTLALIVGLPWIAFVLGFPVYSTFALEARLGGHISFLPAFVTPFALFQFGTLGDLVLLDWLIISKVTPGFVVIPGSDKADYKDFSHHFSAHWKATLAMLVLSAAIGAVMSRW